MLQQMIMLFFFLLKPPSEISLYLMVQSVGSREKLSLDRQLCDSDKALILNE